MKHVLIGCRSACQTRQQAAAGLGSLDRAQRELRRLENAGYSSFDCLRVDLVTRVLASLQDPAALGLLIEAARTHPHAVVRKRALETLLEAGTASTELAMEVVRRGDCGGWQDLRRIGQRLKENIARHVALPVWLFDLTLDDLHPVAGLLAFLEDDHEDVRVLALLALPTRHPIANRLNRIEDDARLWVRELVSHRVASLDERQTLTLNRQIVGDDGARRLADSGVLAGITALEMGWTELSSQGLRALLASDQLGDLRRLDLPGNPLGDESLRVLATSPVLMSLEKIDLSESDFSADAMRSLVTSPGMGRIRRLHVKATPPHLEALAHLPGMEELVLSRGDARQAATTVVTSRGFNRLAVLRLVACRVDDALCEALAAVDGTGRLRILDLTRCSGLTDAGLTALSQAGLLAGLRELVLQEAHVENGGLQALAGSRVLAGLRRLDLSLNNIGPEGALALAQSPFLERLEWLDVSYNRLKEHDRDVTDAGTVVAREPADPEAVQLRARFGTRVDLGP